MFFLKKDWLETYQQQIGEELASAWHNFAPQEVDFDFYLTASAVNSAQIEGNTLDLNSFMNQSQSQPVSKQAQEIHDLKTAYQRAAKMTLTEENFLWAHWQASESLLAGAGGRYRQTPVGVFSEDGLTYLAVKPELVEEEMKKLWLEIVEILKQNLLLEEVFYYASLIHLRLVLIHPFVDGNGRLARLIEKWFLATKLGEKAWYLQSEAAYFSRRSEYYQRLRLGVNYYEVDEAKVLPFLLMLAKSVKNPK